MLKTVRNARTDVFLNFCQNFIEKYSKTKKLEHFYWKHFFFQKLKKISRNSSQSCTDKNARLHRKARNLSRAENVKISRYFFTLFLRFFLFFFETALTFLFLNILWWNLQENGDTRPYSRSWPFWPKSTKQKKVLSAGSIFQKKSQKSLKKHQNVELEKKI